MDRHIKDFFSTKGKGTGHFHEVIALHERPELTWEEIVGKMEDFPRGWFELAHLSPKDRVDFTAEYWSVKIPFHPHLSGPLLGFFKSLDDIGIFLTKEKKNDPYEATMVYSVSGNRGFFRGALPATYDACMNLQESFSEHILPEDYFAFLQIHNGFHKTTDTTGVIPVQEVEPVYRRFQGLHEEDELVTTRSGSPVDSSTLIPFYESFGLPFFQCFWEEWHHEQGMGNVYYSVGEKVISDPQEGGIGSENLAFPTFTDWLVFYLERID